MEQPEVEIYIRCLDCEICGMEINPNREEYIRHMRVCPRCYRELEGELNGRRGRTGTTGPI